jgi:hypothetical protein
MEMRLSRSLSGLALFTQKNAKKHPFLSIFSLQTPKGALKSEIFEAFAEKIHKSDWLLEIYGDTLTP